MAAKTLSQSSGNSRLRSDFAVVPFWILLVRQQHGGRHGYAQPRGQRVVEELVVGR
jgi:hypothetical protein